MGVRETSRPFHLSDIGTGIAGQHFSFLVLLSLSLLLFRAPLGILLDSFRVDDRYSHAFFIPLISAGLIYFRRISIYKESGYCLWSAPLLLLAMALYRITQRPLLFSDRNDYLSASVLAIVLAWSAAFLLCYGWKSLSAARFPLCFLLLMIPMPTALLDRAIGALQRGSAATTRLLFSTCGVHTIWQGTVFSLNGHSFEIAKECSGIHSCLVLFICGILASYLFVQSTWARMFFSVGTIFVAIFKNAVRIVTISSLTSYVNEAYSNSWIHTSGGVLFALVSMSVSVPLLVMLRKAETHIRRKQSLLNARGQ